MPRPDKHPAMSERDQTRHDRGRSVDPASDFQERDFDVSCDQSHV